MRANRPLVVLVTVFAVLTLGYLAYAVSSGVHPSPAPAPSAQPQHRDS